LLANQPDFSVVTAKKERTLRMRRSAVLTQRREGAKTQGIKEECFVRKQLHENPILPLRLRVFALKPG
jgi:hypothetical protein